MVDDDHLIAAADGPRTSGRVRRWVAVLLVVTLVLAGAQLVLAARDRATSARFAQLPGALPPVDADVGALWRVDEADLEVLPRASRSRAASWGCGPVGDGAASVVSLDPRTGAERWSTPLTDADTVLAQRGARSSVSSCLQVPEADDAEPLVACLVSDALLSFGIRGRLTVTRPPTTSRVVVVDAADGRVVADRTAPPAIAFAVLPGLVAVGLPGHDGHAEVTAQDLLTGEVLWHRSSPRPAVDPVGDVSGFEVVALDDLVAVVEVGSNMTLLAADGTVARERERYDRLSQDEAATRLEVLSGYLAFRPVTTIVQPGRADRRIPGRLVTRTVDDGSLPGIELIEGSRMQARDATTGDRLWQADRHTSGPVLVLRGLVYCTQRRQPRGARGVRRPDRVRRLVGERRHVRPAGPADDRRPRPAGRAHTGGRRGRGVARRVLARRRGAALARAAARRARRGVDAGARARRRRRRRSHGVRRAGQPMILTRSARAAEPVRG